MACPHNLFLPSKIEKWNVRTLRKKMDSMFYERTALSRKPELVAKAELEALRTGINSPLNPPFVKVEIFSTYNYANRLTEIVAQRKRWT